MSPIFRWLERSPIAALTLQPASDDNTSEEDVFEWLSKAPMLDEIDKQYERASIKSEKIAKKKKVKSWGSDWQ